MIDILENLIRLSKSNDNLVEQLLTGIVDDYIEKNGEVDFKYKMNDDTKRIRFFVKYIIFPRSNRYTWYINMNETIKKFGIKDKIIYSEEYDVLKTNELNWYMTYVNPNFNQHYSRLEVLSSNQLYNGRYNKDNLIRSFVLKQFKLEIDNYYDYDLEKSYKRAILYIKYKKSKSNNPLMKLALNNTTYPPNKSKYIFLIHFRIDDINQGEKLLKYLHHFIKDLI